LTAEGRPARPPRLVWRLTAVRHAQRADTGEGARLYGGRWNHAGIPLVYTSETLSLAALELFVHLDCDVAPDHLAARGATPWRSRSSTSPISLTTGGPTPPPSA